MGRPPLRWAPNMDAALKRMVGDHVPLDAVADHIGVDLSVVRKRMKELGLKTRGRGMHVGRKWTDKEEDLLRVMWADLDYDLRDIAQRFGVKSPPTITRKAKNMGLPPRVADKRQLIFDTIKNNPGITTTDIVPVVHNTLTNVCHMLQAMVRDGILLRKEGVCRKGRHGAVPSRYHINPDHQGPLRKVSGRRHGGA